MAPRRAGVPALLALLLGVAAAGRSFVIEHDVFLKDGQPFQIIAGR